MWMYIRSIKETETYLGDNDIDLLNWELDIFEFTL